MCKTCGRAVISLWKECARDIFYPQSSLRDFMNVGYNTRFSLVLYKFYTRLIRKEFVKFLSVISNFSALCTALITTNTKYINT